MGSLQDSLRVQEIFGPTIQGEGHWSGRPCYFVRLWGCPVNCNWCDQSYGADQNYGKDLSWNDVSLQRIVEAIRPATQVVISGGEPLAQQNVEQLCETLVLDGKFVSVETSGVVWRNLPQAVWVTLSPKEHLFADKNFVDERFWRRANEIKIVVENGSELEYYRSRDKLPGRTTPLYLQPEWNSRETSIPKTLELIYQNPTIARLSSQTHKLIGVP